MAPETTTLGPTEQLSAWIASLQLDQVPEQIQERSKYLILDGIACAFVGSHLPWSERAANALLALEPAGGEAALVGWGGRTATPMSAALINSTFLQGFELDDWHRDAPLHSNSILLPALFAAAQHQAAKNKDAKISGKDLLTALLAGYEVGPRVGLALHGAHVLTSGWHSGAVFGPAASAASVGKLLGLDAGKIEDAMGIACTQACGLMSAQFESDAKRMQHGFAARNGLMAAFLAEGGYIGIKKVFEREYGGFLKQFSAGNGKTPAYIPDELTKGLGTQWQTDKICVKAYASMAGTHPTVDCVRKLQELHPEAMKKVGEIKDIKIQLAEAAFHHGGWKTTRPLTATGAQMSNSYVAATQMVHGEVLAAQFRHDMLENDLVWKLVDMTHCELIEGSDTPRGRQIVTVEFKDGTVLSQQMEAARGMLPILTNDEILQKWQTLTKNIVDPDTVKQIEEFVLSLDGKDDISPLLELMSRTAQNAIA